MNEDKFILSETFNQLLDASKLDEAILSYKNKLENRDFIFEESDDLIDLIHTVKRCQEHPIGPYQHITFFEALNRIGSDLVLLAGAKQLLSDQKFSYLKIKNVSLAMGNQSGYDVTVNCLGNKIIYGEAFNVAPSFCKVKMSSTINNFFVKKNGKVTDILKDDIKKNNLALVFCNKGVFETLTSYIANNKRLKRLRKTNSDFKIELLSCDYKNVLN